MRILLPVFLVITLLACTPTEGAIFDFEGLAHGEIVHTQIPGVTVRAINLGGGPNLAVAFNSQARGTRDPDLEGPSWASGNLAPRTRLGNLLILQENRVGARDGIVDLPDDEGSRPAGRLILDFGSQSYDAIGFDLIDIEGTRRGDKPGFIALFKDNSRVGLVRFMDFVDPSSPFYDPTVVFGNNSANRIKAIGGFGKFNRAVFSMGGSGGIDNIEAVPEPGTLIVWTLLCGMATVWWRLKQQKITSLQTS